MEHLQGVRIVSHDPLTYDVWCETCQRSISETTTDLDEANRWAASIKHPHLSLVSP